MKPRSPQTHYIGNSGLNKSELFFYFATGFLKRIRKSPSVLPFPYWQSQDLDIKTDVPDGNLLNQSWSNIETQSILTIFIREHLWCFHSSLSDTPKNVGKLELLWKALCLPDREFNIKSIKFERPVIHSLADSGPLIGHLPEGSSPLISTLNSNLQESLNTELCILLQ